MVLISGPVWQYGFLADVALDLDCLWAALPSETAHGYATAGGVALATMLVLGLQVAGVLRC